LKILIVGGNLQVINGYTNAVLSIAEATGKKVSTYLIPVFTPFYVKKKDEKRSFTLVSKKISPFIIFIMIKYFKRSFFAIKPYCSPFSVTGFLYFIKDTYHRALFAQIIDDLKPDVINIHGLYLDILPFIEVTRDKKVPLCVTIHAISAPDMNIILHYNKNFEEKEMINLVEAKIPIITVSSGVSYLIKNSFKINIEPIIIQNGVDFDRFVLNNQDISMVRTKYGMPQDKLILIQVGTLIKRKNHIVVLEALAEMEKSQQDALHYVIIGDGPERSILEDFCIKKDLISICTFTGQISDADLNALYLISNLFILPSTSEGLALVSLEALAAGIPIIAFEDLQGIQEIYNPLCVQLIKDHTISSVKDAIQEAMNKKWDNDLIKAYAKQWSWDSVSEKYMEIYQNLLK